MSETDIPYGTGTGSQRSWAPGREEGAGGETSGVKERASAVASQVGDVGRETAQDAKERARDVAHEASDRARGLVDRTRSELGSQVASQQQHLAGGLRSLGDELGQMSRGTQDPGYATDLVQRAGEATSHVAQWFEEREPGDVLHEVEDFARRRPGMFLLMAAGAGLLVGRFLRGAKDASGDGGGERNGEGRVSTDRARATSGAYPAPVHSNPPQDPGIPPYAGETPPAFPPPTADGIRPQTTGGERDVERP